jgi:hypothetical protein
VASVPPQLGHVQTHSASAKKLATHSSKFMQEVGIGRSQINMGCSEKILASQLDLFNRERHRIQDFHRHQDLAGTHINMVCHLTIKMGPVSTNIVTMAMVKLKVRSDLCFFCKFGVKSLRLFVITDITKIKWCLFPTIISSLCLALCQFSNKSLVSIG